MQKCAINAAQWPKDGNIMKETADKAQEVWNKLCLRAQDLRQQLQCVPDQWKAYRNKSVYFNIIC
jgi:uncharacterized protein YeaO (DUF488 family)